MLSCLLAFVLTQKPQLCADAKVSDAEQHDFLENRVSGQLVRVVELQVHLLQAERTQVHHVADVEVQDPVFVSLDAEHAGDDFLHYARGIAGRRLGLDELCGASVVRVP